MAYIQDISMLMRELLKVHKDYTPTALEISKYIKSRYSSGSKSRERPPVGSRGFSSDSAEGRPNTFGTPKRVTRTMGKKQSGHRLGGRNIVTQAKFYSRRPVLKRSSKTVGASLNQKKVISERASRDFSVKKFNSSNAKPQSALTHGHRNQSSFWSWQTAKNQIRRTVSDITVASPEPRSKLSVLGDQYKGDSVLDVELAARKREMLKKMVDSGTACDRKEPVRTRQIIYKLLEDTKLEAQRKEIARLTELARAKVREAKKAEGHS